MSEIGPFITKPPAVSLGLLALFCAAWYACAGYGLGIWDHAIHLPYLMRALDPGYLPGDYLLDASDSHASLFWTLQVPFVRLLGVPAFYLLLHIACVAMMLLATARLMRALYPSPSDDGDNDDYAAWPVALALMFVIIGGGSWTFGDLLLLDNHVLNRTLSLGPLLWALALAVEGKPARALSLCGLVFLVHATTASHAAILCWFVAVFGSRTFAPRVQRLRAALAAPLAFAVAASPLLIQMMAGSRASNVPLRAPDEWFDLVALHYPYHHFLRGTPPLTWAVLVTQLVFLAVALRAVGASRPLRALLAGFAACFALGAVGIELLGLAPMVQLHIYEAFRFLPYITACVFARWVSAGLAGQAPFGWASWLACVGYGAFLVNFALTSWQPLASAALAVPALVYGSRTPSRPRRISAVAFAAVFVAAIAAIHVIRPRRGRPWVFAVQARQLSAIPYAACWEYDGAPAEATVGAERCGFEVMTWLAETTPEDALIAVPPYMEHPITLIRWLSRRSPLVTWKDGGEGTFDLAFARAWHQRLQAIADTDAPLYPASITAYRDFDVWTGNIARVLTAYRALDRGGFLRLRARYGVTYAVVERGRAPPALPELYRDSAYAVYQISSN